MGAHKYEGEIASIRESLLIHLKGLLEIHGIDVGLVEDQISRVIPISFLYRILEDLAWIVQPVLSEISHLNQGGSNTSDRSSAL